MKNSNYKIWRQRQFSHTVIAAKNTVALKVIHFDHPKRKAVENFIQKQYRRKFELSACDMMPDIFACFIENELCAAMGFRAADKDKLFLEQYLDRPIEDYMSQHAGIKIKRNNIVEVGSLVTANSVVGRLVIPILSDAVLAQGFAWVALTATDALIHFLHELHHFFFRKTPIMFNESEHVLSSLDVLSLVNYRNLI